MSPQAEDVAIADNGGRRRRRDRRFLVSMPRTRERRTNWDRRSGYDRRLKRMGGFDKERRNPQ
ncbi:MAG: hypothetical protein PVG51_11930 [Desulfosarcina sp.]